ncbi:MAG: hypothetical protein K2H64_00120, partial [Desulfovibrio sp.]|nr:hypothetical protein [Desulfovibrio sp.]
VPIVPTEPRLDLELDDELIQIPDNWKNLKRLKDLRLGYSDFEKFSEVIGQLSSLGSFSYDSGIYIDDKAIATLAKLPLLKKLAFTKMVPPGDLPIDSEKEYSFIFPESLGQLECLEELDLSTNVEMSALPESIKYLKNLKKLTLSNDDSDVWTIQLDSIPTTIGELTNLEELKLFGLVNLSLLPESIINLNKLRVLDIRETDIQHINLTHYQLTRLEWLGVNYPFAPLTQCHSLKELNYLLGDAFLFRGKFYKTSAKKPFDRKDLEPLTNLSSLEKLYIHGGILTGTHFLTELTHLEELGLSSNFSFLPANIDKLQKLRRLNIWGATALTSLPETLALIPALKYIRCASCGIKEPPAWLKDRPDIKFEIE